jgi:hypothetical protein
MPGDSMPGNGIPGDGITSNGTPDDGVLGDGNPSDADTDVVIELKKALAAKDKELEDILKRNKEIIEDYNRLVERYQALQDVDSQNG